MAESHPELPMDHLRQGWERFDWWATVGFGDPPQSRKTFCLDGSRLVQTSGVAKDSSIKTGVQKRQTSGLLKLLTEKLSLLGVKSLAVWLVFLVLGGEGGGSAGLGSPPSTAASADLSTTLRTLSSSLPPSGSSEEALAG